MSESHSGRRSYSFTSKTLNGRLDRSVAKNLQFLVYERVASALANAVMREGIGYTIDAFVREKTIVL